MHFQQVDADGFTGVHPLYLGLPAPGTDMLFES